jgi:hypothetical protein
MAGLQAVIMASGKKRELNFETLKTGVLCCIVV